MTDIQKQYNDFVRMINNEEDDCRFFMLANNSFLVKVEKEKIDLNFWVKFVLVERDLDQNGKWIGFEKAREGLGIKK